jgi:hypothetical protein
VVTGAGGEHMFDETNRAEVVRDLLAWMERLTASASAP